MFIILFPFVLPLIFFLFITAIKLGPKYLSFKKSKYREGSGNGFLKTIFDKGSYGEFLTFQCLENLDGFYRLLTNVYIPREDGTTTEIDLILLSPTGIYVIESKNYSGWIFGDEDSRNWTQSLRNGEKNKFFNPICQNKAHINALKKMIGIDEEYIYKSYIVFSERCEIKKGELSLSHLKVLKREELLKTIKDDIKNAPFVLDADRLMAIYSMLKEHCNVDERIKREHIDNIKIKRI